MSEQCPSDHTAMANIKGVGEYKLEKYGADFIKAITEYLEGHGRKVEGSGGQNKCVDTPARKPEREKNPSHVITWKMYQEGKPLTEIARERGIKISTVQEHLFKCCNEGLAVNLDQFIPGKYESLILEAIQKLGTEKLKPIKEALPEEIEYSEIKAVIYKYRGRI